ncbi:RNA polymerase factor sigma-54 [Lysinibacillus yapensis]|nr:RNA polymerase factor sigma-54 [Lysinibacillus yapensis]
MSMHLQQKLEAKLVLTPQLKQSLEVLKLSVEELESYIREEANSNPLIELKEQITTERTIDMARLHDGDFARGSISTGEEPFDVFNQIASPEVSLEQYLMEQLAMEKGLARSEKEVLLYFIRSLNDSGYLICDVEEVALQYGLEVDDGERLLKILQNFEPTGIAARSLSECLLIQIQHHKNAPPLAAEFAEKHLEDLADRQFQLLADTYEITTEEVQTIFSYIQQLHPRPVIEIENRQTEYIIPDIIVEILNGEMAIRINDGFLPQISINTYYEELLRINKDAEVNNYLKTKLSDALLLMKGIEQRHETLYKVTSIVLQRQKDFLKDGKKALKPLRLKDVAELVELHESTISRAIHDKCIQTPKGIFPLKAFFVRGIKTESGEAASTILIKEKIKAIIEGEDLRKPLSDQKIANILMAEGIQIARRTVAKYREELGIMQSTKRSRKK